MPEFDHDFVASVATRAAREAIQHERKTNHDELSNIALAAAKEAVRETHSEMFALLGVNISNFDDIKSFRADLEFLTAIRTKTHQVGNRITVSFVTIIIGAAALALWIGITNLAKHPP